MRRKNAFGVLKSKVDIFLVKIYATASLKCTLLVYIWCNWKAQHAFSQIDAENRSPLAHRNAESWRNRAADFWERHASHCNLACTNNEIKRRKWKELSWNKRLSVLLLSAAARGRGSARWAKKLHSLADGARRRRRIFPLDEWRNLSPLRPIGCITTWIALSTLFIGATLPAAAAALKVIFPISNRVTQKATCWLIPTGNEIKIYIICT